jgi:prepilin-type processing-associated H-X9-DG protein
MTPLNVDQFMKASCSPVCEPVRTPLNQDPQAGAGFSQADLLAVLGVLALLGLLLTPALARTRVTDQGFQCRNNLRRMMQAWQMYADENSGKLSKSWDWVGGWLSYAADNADNTNLSYLINGGLGPYLKSPSIYKCPADMSQGIEGGVRMPRVRSFSMSQSFSNYNEGHLEDGDSPPNYWRHYSTSADLVRPTPANLWVIIDESPDSLNDGAFAVGMSQGSPRKWQDGPSILHDGGCGFAFADGHSEIKQWTDSRTLAMKVTYTSSFPYGWTQPNNPDIKWLQDRTTAPKR